MTNITQGRLIDVQKAETGNVECNGSSNEIFPMSVLSWDASNNEAIVNASGANYLAGVAADGSDSASDNIEVYRKGVVKILTADITGTVDVGLPVYMNDTDNMFDDLTMTAGSHTFFANVIGIEGSYALLEFDVSRTRP